MRWRSPRFARQGRVLVGAALLFAAVFAGRLADGSAASGLTILYVLPVVLVGFVAGQLADRLHVAATEAQASARHFELARDLLCTVDFDGFMTHVNGAWEDCLGWSSGELMARPFIELVHPDDRERTEAEAARAMVGDFTASFTNRYRTKDGRWRWIEWSSRVDPEQRTIHAAARDVTDRLLVEQARLEAEERFHRAFEDSATGMAVVGVEGAERELIMEANESLGRIFGCSRRELIGSRMLSELIDPAHVPAVACGMEQLMRGAEAVHRNEYRMIRADGTRIWLDLTASLVRDVDGHPRYRLVQVLDVTERKTAADQLRFLADHDPLSGVYNRRRFEQELGRELDRGARRQRRSVVLLLDVDGFKAINDALGHATGDAVIARLGDTLRGRLRSGDVVARLGGDEFAVILRRADVASAREIARDLQLLMVERLAPVVGDGHAPVTLSIGLAPIGGEEAIGVDELLGRADRALYAAKRAGKDRVVVAGLADSAPVAPLAQPIPAAVARLIGDV